MKLALTIAAVISLCHPLVAVTVAQVETGVLRFAVTSDGAELWDKKARVAWRTSPGARFGTVTLLVDGKPRRIDLTAPELAFKNNGLQATFHPLSEQPAAALRVRARPRPDGRTLEVSYRADEALRIDSISLFEDLLGVTDSAKGYVVVPVREGLLIPADSGLAFEHRFDTYTYEGCHMAMFGAVQNGAAVLVWWEDPYVAAIVKSVTNNASAGPGQRVTPSLVLRKSANSFCIQVLGQGDYVGISKAYRKIAAEKGWLVTWEQKLKGHPERAKLFGAANIKLWSMLDRRMNEDSSKEESVQVNWTFDEAAQVAEHLKRDLKLDKVLFTVGGWIHRGYDNQHPDILPTAPECGGDAAFADMAKRVMALGYLLCLHDNYQDIYRDAPSWDERFVMRTPDGKLAKGGHWAGGVAWLTCSKLALELAKRPGNLSAVRSLCEANSYFIDTTYAAGLQECFDPAHPLTRADDMKWKQAISDYAREIFGVFGSECGREWAIPHSDFFEGLTGVSGTYCHDATLLARLGATVVPLFELVYRDCIAMYGKYEYDPARTADYVLHHISLGRHLNYHSIPQHLYWSQKDPPEQTLAVRPAVDELKQMTTRQFQVSYGWTIEEPVAGEWMVFVHFTDRSGDIKFQNDYHPTPSIAAWQPGETRQGPFTVTIPEGLTGTFNIRMGLFQPRSEQSAVLQGRDDGGRSYMVGRLIVVGDKIEFQPPEPASSESLATSPFIRGGNGWSEGLHPMDRFIKNTCEILGPLNELTSRMQMSTHEFLTRDRTVRRTVFGKNPSGVEVIVNIGRDSYRCSSRTGGAITLPPSGFLVESPTFVAFHALNWADQNYDTPAMFALRSLDERSILRSRQLRIFHAFGSDKILIGKSDLTVPRELTFTPNKN